MNIIFKLVSIEMWDFEHLLYIIGEFGVKLDMHLF